MLTLAAYYLNPEKITSLKRDEVWIDMECVTVFLILHIPESNNSTKPPTIASTFDSVWPLNADGEVYPTSPVASPSVSPVKDSNRSTSFKSPTPLGSPMSPKSPKNTHSPGQAGLASSPKRSTSTSARTPRASTQHLLSVRQKIPLIVSALNPSLSQSHSYDISDEFGSNVEVYQVSRKILDAFGMMLSGGHSRDHTVKLPFPNFLLKFLCLLNEFSAFFSPNLDCTLFRFASQLGGTRSELRKKFCS
jgi:hypothetical protein